MSTYGQKYPFFRGFGTISVVLWLCSLGISCPAARKGTSDSKLVDLVISAQDANYSTVESARLTMRETVRDLSVGKSDTVATRLPDGRTLTVLRSPHNITTMHLLLRGSYIRCERRAADSENGKIIELYGFQDGVWTQHVPSIATGWRRFTDKMAAIFPLDPRQVGSPDVRRSLRQILEEDKIVSAEMIRGNGSNSVQIVATSSEGETTTFLFSAKDRFLPTQFYTKWDDGSLLQHVEIGYQPVLGDGTLFPKWIRRRFYAKGRTKLPDTSGWREETLREVVGDIQFNTHIEKDAMAVSLPAGTRVVDVTRGRIYGTKEPLKERSSLPFLLNVIAIVVLLGLIVIRSYRSRKSLAVT